MTSVHDFRSTRVPSATCAGTTLPLSEDGRGTLRAVNFFQRSSEPMIPSRLPTLRSSSGHRALLRPRALLTTRELAHRAPISHSRASLNADREDSPAADNVDSLAHVQMSAPTRPKLLCVLLRGTSWAVLRLSGCCNDYRARERMVATARAT